MEYLIFILEGRIPDWHPRRDFSGTIAGGIPELGQIDNGTFHTRAKIQILCGYIIGILGYNILCSFSDRYLYRSPGILS